MVDLPSSEVAVDDGRRHARSAAAMTALTAVSRGTGLVRIVVVTNVLGTTYLANTYQTANTVPNILFELLAAGALQAVLIPTMVDLLAQENREDARHVVGAVLGLSVTVLAGVAAAGIVAAPQLMRLMVRDVEDPAIRAAEVRLGTFFLWFFLPQIVLYAANVVATAVLNAHGRFALPVFAPAVNNVVVVVAYLVFDAMRDGPPSLDLSTAEKLVLAGGTTLGVVTFCALPVVASARLLRLRPSLDHRHPAVRRLAGEGAWAAAFLALSQVLLVATLQIANRREGAVAVYQLAFVLYLLPHALFSVPQMTTRFPLLSRQASAGDWQGYAATVAGGIRGIAYLGVLATAVLVALATPLARLVVRGDVVRRVDEIGDATAGFAPGIVGFGLLLFLTRACYAERDARTPTIVNGAVAVAGVAAMFALADQVRPALLVASLGWCLAAAQTGGAVALWAVVHRRLAGRGVTEGGVGIAVARSLAAGVAAALAVRWLAERAGQGTVPRSLTVVVVGATATVALYAALQYLLGGPSPLAAARTFGAAERSAGARP